MLPLQVHHFRLGALRARRDRLSTTAQLQGDFIPPLVRSRMPWVGGGVYFASLIKCVPGYKDAPLLPFKSQFLGIDRPDKESAKVLIFFFVPLRNETMGLTIHTGNSGARTVIPLAFYEDVLRRAVHKQRGELSGLTLKLTGPRRQDAEGPE